jgi:beta-lactam-binding protein with PASTA domain
MTGPEHVLVPALVGLDIADAHELALTARVAVVGEDPDVPLPLSGVVTAQEPGAGTQVYPGDPVMIRVIDGGGGGGGSARIPPGPRPRDPAGVK